MRRLLVLLAVALVGVTALAGEDYGAKLDVLLPKLASENVGELNGAQQTLFEMCSQASAPGADGRAAVCEAMASRLGKAAPLAKVWMLRQLERIGRAEAVPAIAALLTDADEKVCDSARRAMQNIPGIEAAQAAAKALETADKSVAKIGLLNALATHEADAGAFSKLLQQNLKSDDEAVRTAAAMAIARTGDKSSVEALLDVAGKGTPATQTNITTASLMLADQLCLKGDKTSSLSLFKKLYARTGYAKSAAVIGLAKAGGTGELDTILAAMADPDSGLRGAAVEAINYLPKPDACRALLAKLKDAGSKDATVSMLRALGWCGDASAVPALATASTDADEETRVAALRSMGMIGDGSAVPALVKAAAAGGPAANTARESLDRLTGKDAGSGLLGLLKDADPKIRAEAARSIGAHRVDVPIEPLLTMASDADPAVRAEAFKALSGVVKAENLPALAAVVVKTSDSSDAAVAAVLSAAQQIPDAATRADAVAAECGKASGAGKLALWRVLGKLGGAKALEVLRAGVKDADAEAQKAAVKAMGEWPDVGAAEDLITLAKGAPNEVLQVLALRGYIRLAGLIKEKPADAIKMYQTAMEAAKRPDEKRLVLGGLGEVFDLAALQMVEPLIEDATLKEEACAAAASIGKEIQKKNPDAVRATMEKVIATAKVRETVQKAMQAYGSVTMGEMDIRVANDPKAEKGVNFAYYEGEWDKLPDFDKLKAKKTGKQANFDLSKREQDENYAFKFTGFLNVTQKAIYSFSTNSDDGSRLLIGDKVVVDSDGCHGEQEVIGKLELEPGMHPITVLFFQRGGGAALTVRGGRMK
ncbi:MAG TPA: HEAT repeat domain-containing protein [Planctomycetota bacterium]|jgi:HEAT repeat protein